MTAPMERVQLVRAPAHAVEALLAGTLHTLLELVDGDLSVQVEPDAILVRADHAGDAETGPASRGDRGPGLGLLKRLAEEIGWTLDMRTGARGLEVRLHWPLQATASRAES
ncbi:MAG TPA: hypothetical protein PKZ76_01425 [Xanthomonadaceae bacterium]|nr:hypothetical protein [Xanthomonadaceae bacterium]